MQLKVHWTCPTNIHWTSDNANTSPPAHWRTPTCGRGARAGRGQESGPEARAAETAWNLLSTVTLDKKEQLHPIHLLRVVLFRVLESNFPGDSL